MSSLGDRAFGAPRLAFATTAIVLAVTGALVVAAGPVIVAALFTLAAVAIATGRSRRDSATLLIGVVLVLFVWPAPLRVASFGAAGTAASIGGLICAWAWAAQRLRSAARGHYRVVPLRYAAYVLVGSTFASLLAAFTRTTDGLETKAALRGFFVIVSSAGVLLFTAESIPGRERLDHVVQAIVIGTSLAAAIGILQFTTGVDLAANLSAPGFSRVVSDWSAGRSGFTRLKSTMEHPIEFSAVLAIVLPLALHLVFQRDQRRRWLWRSCVTAIVLALPMTVSRTGVVGLAVGLFFALWGWTWNQRLWVAVLGLPVVVAIRLLFTGLVGTLVSLFVGAKNDPSVDSRQVAMDAAVHRLSERPLLGRGFATWIPTKYRFIDNQYLTTLIETGVIGLAALTALYVVGIGLARGVRLRSDDPADRSLAQALVASIAALACTSLFYDALSFSTGRSVGMLVLGCAAALWHFTRQAAEPAPSAPRPSAATAAAAPITRTR